jgi:hypothetical protein
MAWPQLHRLQGKTLLSLLGAAATLVLLPAWAQACTLGNLAAPSENTRLFISDRLSIAFSLPDNYRAMLRRTGHVTLHDPTTFAFLQCLARNGRYGRVPLHVTVEVAPVSVDNRHDLAQLVRYKRPWLDYYNPALTATTFAGQPALEYRYIQAITGAEIANISFLQPDGATLITVTGPSNDPVLQTVLTTFELPTLNFLDSAPQN